MVASNRRVLVVDDEEIVCESCKRVLTEDGYSVSTARSGLAALNACRTEPFDVVLADLKMPDMDGLDVARALKKEFPHVRVIIVTGYPSQKTLEESQRIGVFDYLPKPLAADRLSAITAAALEVSAKPLPSLVPFPEKAKAERIAAVVPSEVWEDEAVESVPAPASESVWKMLGLLVAAPLIGLAYVMFLPILGFGMLLAVLGRTLTKGLGSAKI